MFSASLSEFLELLLVLVGHECPVQVLEVIEPRVHDEGLTHFARDASHRRRDVCLTFTKVDTAEPRTTNEPVPRLRGRFVDRQYVAHCVTISAGNATN